MTTDPTDDGQVAAAELTGHDARMAEFRAAPPGCAEDGCGHAAAYVVFNKSGRATPVCPVHAIEKLAGAAGWDAREIEES